MSKTNPKVDTYLKKAKKWQEEMTKLRKIILSCPLTEEFKWNKPCYAFEGSNVVVILGLKNYCTLLFCKGALLKDAKKILVKAGENTQAARQLRLTSLQEIVKMESTLKAYVSEAVEVQKAGLEVEYKAITEIKLVEELQKKLDKNRALKAAFEALTPGRQRAYNIFFAAAKQSATRESRIEKCTSQILKGIGLNDEYRSMKK
jgi:uncharacterized protein YdeI (YjbR/CyaY-like superfamily)